MRENLPGEEWRDVVGYEGLYEVSSRGRIYSCGKQKVLSDKLRGPYRHANLYLDGKATCRTIHSLVAEAFIGPRPAGLVINHRDGNQINNTPANLEYVTQSYNAQHAVDTGLTAVMYGEDTATATITNQQAAEIVRLFYDEETPLQRIADSMRVPYQTVRYICQHKIWQTATTDFVGRPYKATLRKINSRLGLNKKEFAELVKRRLSGERLKDLAREYEFHVANLCKAIKKYANDSTTDIKPGHRTDKKVRGV